MEKLTTPINNNNNQNQNQMENPTNPIIQLMKDKNYEFVLSEKPTLTSKQKFINNINSEIQIMKVRNDFNLIPINKKGDEYTNRKDEKSVYEFDRIENRFHIKSDDIVRFNFKYKGKIIILPTQKTKKNENGKVRVIEYLKCENNIETYINMLNNFKDVFNMIDENDEFFTQIKNLDKK